MSPPDEDPSGYQRLIVRDATAAHRWFLAIFTAGMIGAMLFFDRWQVLRWALVLLVQLGYRMLRSYLDSRSLGYGAIARRDRHAVTETVIAMTIIVGFVLMQSWLGLWFSQDEFRPRWGRYGQYG